MGERITTERARELVEAATPGPWRGDRNDGTVKYAIIGADGRYVLTCDHKNGRYGFVVGDEWGDVVGGEHDADERLTLAAPDLAADLIAARAEIETTAKQRDNAFGYVSSIEGALNDAGVQDWIEHWGGHPEEPPSAEQADPLSRVMMLVEERDALKRDLIAARERIAALEAERDARVTVEEHARAVREAWLDAWDANADNADDRAHFWSVSHVRRDLIATLDAIAALVGPGDVVERLRALVVAIDSREYADRVTP